MSFTRNSPSQTSSQDKVIGLFVLVALILVAYLFLQQFYFVADKKNWISVRSIISNSHGLSKSTLIELSGVTIGNVESVTLREDATVEVIALIDHDYQSLLHDDSQLKINSQLGLDSVLSGTGLEFVPGQSGQLLADGSTIEIVEPKSLSQMMDEMQLQDLAEKVQSIVSNLEKVTSNIAARQQDMADAMKHMGEFSGELVTISRGIPELLGNVNATTVQLQSTLHSLDQNVSTAVAPAVELMNTSNSAVAGVETTLKVLQPTLEQLPALLMTADQAAQSVDSLTRSLNDHWLIGGEGPHSLGVSDHVELMADNELYQENN